VLPLREGGSLPGLVEADDLGTYVVKFRGAGQGVKALAAEVVVGERARRLGLPVPELVVIDLDPSMAPAEPDQEVQDLLRASGGDNLGMDYLPGALGLDVSVDRVDADLAADIVWFDALVQNVDRSWRNPNILLWHRKPWLIDHGAALFWHHAAEVSPDVADKPYRGAADHVLLRAAAELSDAHARLAPKVTEELLTDVTDAVPAEWLEGGEQQRRTYVEVLARRVAAPDRWLDEVEVARARRL
jgi:hypothetical protein